MIKIITREDLYRVYNALLTNNTVKPDLNIGFDLEYLIENSNVVTVLNKENKMITHHVITLDLTVRAVIDIVCDPNGKMVMCKWNENSLYNDQFMNVVNDVVRDVMYKPNELYELGITIKGESLSHRTQTTLTIESDKFVTTFTYPEVNYDPNR